MQRSRNIRLTSNSKTLRSPSSGCPCRPLYKPEPRCRYTLAPWVPSIDRHADRACSREHLDQTAPPQGRPVGTGLRRCCLGIPAGPGVRHRDLPLAGATSPDRVPGTPDRPAHRPGSRVVPRRPWSSNASAAPNSRSSRCCSCSVAASSGYTSVATRHPPLRTGRTLLAAPAVATAKSIAVLPFVNMSGDAGQRVFRGWIVGGVAQPAGKDPGAAGGGAHLGLQVQGREDQRAGGRRRSSTSLTCSKAACASRATRSASRRS